MGCFLAYSSKSALSASHHFFFFFCLSLGHAAAHIPQYLMCVLAYIKKAPFCSFAPSLTDTCPPMGSWMAWLKWAMIVLMDDYLSGLACFFPSLGKGPGFTQSGARRSLPDMIGKPVSLSKWSHTWIWVNFSRCFFRNKLHASGCAACN